MQSRKTYGWRGRLTQYLVDTGRNAYEPGRWDCAQFVAGAVEVMTGEKHALIGYDTIAGGMKLLKKAGHTDHIAYVASLFPDVPVALAQAGDVAVVPGEDGDALGLVQGEYIYVLTPEGRGTVPLLTATRAFRV